MVQNHYIQNIKNRLKRNLMIVNHYYQFQNLKIVIYLFLQMKINLEHNKDRKYREYKIVLEYP